MSPSEKVNILLVDDQPAKLMSYEVILSELGENLIKANSATEALHHLLRHEIAVVLIDVVMPDLDGFELAAMIREHPRCQRVAIIFVSAIQLSEPDFLRGYEAGAVDYVPVPVVPKLLRAKVRVFADLYRKTRQLEQLNAELERRVDERTAELATGQLGTGTACGRTHARTRIGSGAGARDAEAGEPRPAHRRRRARFQQPADGDPRQPSATCANGCRMTRGCCAWWTARCRAPTVVPR